MLRAAGQAASRYAATCGAGRVEERNLVDTYTNRALAGIHQCLSTRLHKHDRAAFCASVRNELGVSDADARIIRKRHQDFGNDTALRLDGAIGKRQALIRPNEPAAPGTDVARFFVKLSLGERLFRALRGTPPSRLKERDVPASSSAVLGAQPSFAPRRLCKLWVNKFPPCLRFHPGGVRLQGSSDMAAAAASRRYTGLDSLSRDLFQTVHDNHMHEVVADVRTDVDKHAAVMRIKGREQLHTQLAVDSRLARVEALCTSGAHEIPQALRGAVHAAFDAAVACDALLTGAAPLSVARRDELQAAFFAGLTDQPLAPVLDSVKFREARSSAYQAGKAGFAALAGEAGQPRADALAYALRGAFSEGLRHPTFLDHCNATVHLSELPLSPAKSAEFGRKLVELAEARYHAERAAAFDAVMRPRVEAWEQLAEQGGASREDGRVAAMRTAVTAGAEAKAKCGAARKRFEELARSLENWCRDERMPAAAVAGLWHAIDPAMAELPAGEGPGEAGGAQRAQKVYTHVRAAAEAIIAGVHDVESRLDIDDQALRDRLALTVIGRSTLGEFNRWTEGEINFAISIAGSTGRAAHAAVAAAPSVVHAEAAPEANAAGRVEFDSQEAGITHHLARRVHGYSDVVPKPADEAGAAEAPQEGAPPQLPAGAPEPLEEWTGIFRSKGIEDLSRAVMRRTHSMPAVGFGGRPRPE